MIDSTLAVGEVWAEVPSGRTSTCADHGTLEPVFSKSVADGGYGKGGAQLANGGRRCGGRRGTRHPDRGHHSCTTLQPSAMIAAGMLEKKAVSGMR